MGRYLCYLLLLLLYAKLPFGVAPGMGLNAFFAYTLVINGGVAWPTWRFSIIC